MIVDGNSLARPAFEAGRECKKFFLSRLIDFCATVRPSITAVAWDRPDGSQIRKAIHPGYKANRPIPPPEFYEQIDELQTVLRWLGVTQYDGPGEADDVIATITRTMPGLILIVSMDKDLIQLVRPGIHQWRFVKPPQLITPETCKDVTGKTPGEWLTFQTLAGDPGDKVPGLPGVGPKTAKRLMGACPDIVELLLEAKQEGDDHVRAQVAENDPKMSKWVELAIKERKLLELTRKLVKLQTIEVNVMLADLDPHRAEQWLYEHEMGWMVKYLIHTEPFW